MNHNKSTSLGDRIADKVADTVGSWRFIVTQSIIIILWITLNGFVLRNGWDPYPFILLNLGLSFQAAYTAPIIMMSQNRMESKDRERARIDLQTDRKAEREIQALQEQMNRVEEKLDFLLKREIEG